MARARNLKPGFFKNEDLAECTVWARLCFAGLWLLADREGRLEDRPKRIKCELFAYDSVEVEPLLSELEQHGFILRYRAPDGRGVIQVLQFLRHQNPHHREPESDLPPPQSPGLCPDAIATEHGADDARNGQQAQGKPEALTPLQPPEALGQPRASPGLGPPRVDLGRGSSRAESGIDESGTLIPEEEKARKRARPPDRPPDVAEQVWADWLQLRKAKRAPVTATVMAEAEREAGKAGLTLEAFLRVWCSRGSQGLQAAWLQPQERGRSPPEADEPGWRREQRERNEAFLGPYAAKRRRLETIDMEPPHGAESLLG